jgi:hypothetical protein
VGDDADGAGMSDPLARGLLAILVPEPALADVEDTAVEDPARIEALEA